jgi:hypothetical protein
LVKAKSAARTFPSDKSAITISLGRANTDTLWPRRFSLAVARL